MQVPTGSQQALDVLVDAIDTQPAKTIGRGAAGTAFAYTCAEYFGNRLENANYDTWSSTLDSMGSSVLAAWATLLCVQQGINMLEGMQAALHLHHNPQGHTYYSSNQYTRKPGFFRQAFANHVLPAESLTQANEIIRTTRTCAFINGVTLQEAPTKNLIRHYRVQTDVDTLILPAKYPIMDKRAPHHYALIQHTNKGPTIIHAEKAITTEHYRQYRKKLEEQERTDLVWQPIPTR